MNKMFVKIGSLGWEVLLKEKNENINIGEREMGIKMIYEEEHGN